MKRSHHGIALGLLALCDACATTRPPPTVRVGTAVEAPPGPPRGACEEERWVEAYPALAREERTESRSMQRGTETVSLPPRRVTEEALGYAVYRAAAGSTETPLNLRELLSPLGLRDIERAHLARRVDFEARSERSSRVRTAGLITLGSGVALILLAVPLSSESREVTLAFGLTGAGALLAGGITALVGNGMGPSLEDDEAVAIRDRMFVPPEVSLDGVRTVITRHNTLVRASCGTPAQPAPAPSAAPVARPTD